MRSTRKVIFPKQDGVAKVRQKKQSRPTDHLSPTRSSTMAGATAALYAIPATFCHPPLIKDSLVTATSSAQDENIQQTLPLIKATGESASHPFDYNEHGVPQLDRLQHIEFLRDALGGFPGGFVSMDASRPWMVYWGLMGLHLLGEDVTDYRNGLVPPAAMEPSICTILYGRLKSFRFTNLSCPNHILMLSQCHQNVHPHAKRHWRFRWGTWAASTSSSLLCRHTQSCACWRP